MSVGGGLVGVGGDFHACGAGLVPTGAVAYEVASPTGGIDAVADVGGESGGREVGVVEGGAEDGGPVAAVEIGVETRKKHAAAGHVVVGVVYHGVALGSGLAEDEGFVVATDADEEDLVVLGRAVVGGGHELVAVVGDFGYEPVGTAAAIVGLECIGGGGEIGGVGAAANDDVVAGVYIDGVDCIVATTAEVGGPDEVAEVIVDFEDNAALGIGPCGHDGVGGGGEIGGEGGAADIDVVEVVGDEFATGTVAIVVVERVVAVHDDIAVVVSGAVVDSVVVGATDEGGGLQLGAGAVETADADVAAIGEIDGVGVFELQGGSAVEGGVVGVGGDGEIGRPGGAEDDKFVEGVDIHAVGHVGIAAAEIGGEEALGAVAVEFEYTDIGNAVVGSVVCTYGDGIADAEDDAGGVGVFVVVVGGGGAPVVGLGAGVGGEMEHGVDGEGEGGVVGVDDESNSVAP